MPKVGDLSEDEADLLELIAQWAKAVREENLPGIIVEADRFAVTVLVQSPNLPS